jgi:hypothetical protein
MEYSAINVSSSVSSGILKNSLGLKEASLNTSRLLIPATCSYFSSFLSPHQTIVERIDRTEFFQKLLVGSFFLSSNFVLVAFLDLPALHEFILDFIDRLAGMRDDVELIGDLLRPYSKIVAFPGVERFAGAMVF